MNPLVGALSVLLLAHSAHASTLVLRSSTAFDSGLSDKAWGASAPSTRTVFVAGETGGNFSVAQFDKDLIFKASAAFSTDGSGGAAAVTVDSAGNVVVAGSSSSAKFVVLKYGPALNFLSSATFALGSVSLARAVAVDSHDDILVAGDVRVGTEFRYAVVKYGSDLRQLASATYNDGGVDHAYGVAVDASDNVIVTGLSQQGASFNFLTLKYDPNLAGVTASHALDHLGQADQAQAVAVHPSGDIYVAGKTSPDGGSTFDVLVARYSSTLSLRSSVAYDAGGSDWAEAVAVDPAGDLIVAGETNARGTPDFLVLKFTPGLVLVSSATQNNSGTDHGHALAVDPGGNMILAGESNDGTNPPNFGVVKFNGPPISTAASRGQQAGTFQVLQVYGENFIPGSAVSFSTGGIASRGAVPDSSEVLRYNVDIASVPLGRYDLTVTNPDGSSCTLKSGLEVVYSKDVTAAAGGDVVAAGAGGDIRFTIPAGAFGSDFSVTFSSPASIPSTDPLRIAGPPLEAIQTPSLGAASSSMTVVMYYRPQDIVGLTQESLTISWYDPVMTRWINLPSAVDTIARKVTAAVNHFSLFAILTTAAGAGVGGNVRVFPNPYKPGSSGDFGDPPEGHGMMFTGLPAPFSLQIFNVVGQPVFEYSGNPTLSGQFLWNTNDRRGRPCASGVYVYIVTDSSGKKLRRSKFSIIR